jgi:hypothetical protein
MTPPCSGVLPQRQADRRHGLSVDLEHIDDISPMPFYT